MNDYPMHADQRLARYFDSQLGTMRRVIERIEEGAFLITEGLGIYRVHIHHPALYSRDTWPELPDEPGKVWTSNGVGLTEGRYLSDLYQMPDGAQQLEVTRWLWVEEYDSLVRAMIHPPSKRIGMVNEEYINCLVDRTQAHNLTVHQEPHKEGEKPKPFYFRYSSGDPVAAVIAPMLAGEGDCNKGQRQLRLLLRAYD